MKFYEIRRGAIENLQSLTPVEDSQYINLSDAVNCLKHMLEDMEANPAEVTEDLCLTIVRVAKSNAKKKSKPKETVLVQSYAGIDEDTNNFVYEGVAFLTFCNEFEAMILAGQSEVGSLGRYCVQMIEGNNKELCYFSDMGMIIASLAQISSTRHIVNKKVIIFNRTQSDKPEEIAVLNYSLNEDGTIQMACELKIDETHPDYELLHAFLTNPKDFLTPSAEEPTEEVTEEAEETVVEEVVEETVEEVTEIPAE